MKKILFTILLLAAAINTYAFDFSAVCSTGQTLYYNITSDSTVEITYPGNLGRQYLYGLNGSSCYSFTDPYIRYDWCSGYYSYWRVDEGSGYGTIYDRPSGNMIIPNTITRNGSNYKVTAISDYAFFDCTGLTSVSLPSTLTTIGERAFEDCGGLQSITIQNSVTSIGAGAFSTCSALIAIEIPNSITTLEPDVFQSCSSLTKVIIPNSIDSVKNSVFWGCTGIDSLIIGTGVGFIGNGAFSGCENITYIEYNAKHNTCGLFSNQNDGPFFGTNNLPNINVLIIGDSVSYIPPRCFYNCGNVESLIWSNNIRVIDEYAFFNCNLWTKLFLPDSIINIGSYAFGGCPNIDTMYIGSNLVHVGSNAFYDCNNVRYYYYNTPHIPFCS